MPSEMKAPHIQQVIGALRALSTEIDRLDQVAADRYGLNRTDMAALDVIGQAGSLSPTDLARRVGLTTGGITTVIDRLERAGYVRRVADSRDRRRLLIEKTRATTERDREVFGGLLRIMSASLAGHTEAELAVIEQFLERTREITGRYAADLAQNRTEGGRRPARRASVHT